MSELLDLHLRIHPIVVDGFELVADHLFVATLLSGLLIATTFLVRDPRVRRAAALSAVLVLVVPLPDVLPDRGIQTVQISEIALLASDVVASPSPARTSSGLDPLCAGAGLWLLISLLQLARVGLRLRERPACGQRISESLRERLGIPPHIDVRIVEEDAGPRVSGFLRPVIVLPETLIHDTDEDELRAVLKHEVTHVTQKDNTWGTITALASSLLWFHPFVWIASLRFRAATEVVCDAAVLESGVPLKTYLKSILKLIAISPAEHPAGISFSGGSLTERIRMMKSSDPRMSQTMSRAFVVTIALVTLVTALSLKAMIGVSSTGDSLADDSSSVTSYRFEHQIVPLPDGSLRADFVVIDVARNRLLAVPEIRFAPGTPAELRVGNEAPDGESVRIDLVPGPTTSDVTATLSIDRPDEHFERTFDLEVESGGVPGPPLKLSLVEAGLGDVLDLFAKVAQADLVVAADIDSEKVTVSLENLPWDQALDEVLQGRGIHWRKVGNVLVVFSPGEGAIVQPNGHDGKLEEIRELGR